MSKDNAFTKTSVRQPRALWDKVRGDAVAQHKTNDEVLTNILRIHYGVEEK